MQTDNRNLGRIKIIYREKSKAPKTKQNKNPKRSNLNALRERRDAIASTQQEQAAIEKDTCRKQRENT